MCFQNSFMKIIPIAIIIFSQLKLHEFIEILLSIVLYHYPVDTLIIALSMYACTTCVHAGPNYSTCYSVHHNYLTLFVHLYQYTSVVAFLSIIMQ